MEDLFLVQGIIEITRYMVDDSEIKEATRLVWATDATEAENKFYEYFNNKTEEYEIYYNVSRVVVSKSIR